ncbi:MAG: pilus assembly protein [Roseitalea sp.]|mgnify:CR=1 FL=1|jgi:Flp pilus assembly protein TadG|uniref:Pilus assembly protein n=1 Tax=Oceaniradius stylonematis TaxID=2184161 RepID=A0A3A8AAT1_9HYPH|nr:TadE/TadG family type IV pilus assembly protein [Oceaniradius stylonematis]MBO6553617.1 pilus assembly protein [Roseitalea sp.]MBO6952660.1 pilus assembly protein [Rhizobiaceae bacterium]RNC96369.1 MAG: pilus assembly protein [Oricola sp.]MBO6592853.1 pilus assembly protein [Roseitalea sp.]MBO6600404.1 pilus assembly protein [Roseitalea sp.]
MLSHIRSFIVREKDGVAAIEFGLLAPAFFGLLIAIFEICYFVYASTSTQRAVEKAVFDLRTNHAATVVQQRNLTIEEWYRETICGRVSLSTCESTLQITIERYDQDMNQVWSTSDPDQLTLAPRETIMRVEAQVDMPSIMFTDLLFGDQAARLSSGITFMTEP